MAVLDASGLRTRTTRTGDAVRADTERKRWLRPGPANSDGRYVLYWLQLTMRGRQNSALDEAVRMGNALGLPVVVYQGLNPDYPYASSRLHQFVLESARDVARDLEQRGIQYVFHLPPRPEEKGTVLPELVSGAALLVVDDVPTFILPGVTRALLAKTADSGVPVVAFDANGVVPLRLIEKKQYAARTIRPRLERLLPDHLFERPDVESTVQVPDLALSTGIGSLLAEAPDEQIRAWVDGCAVDKNVAPSSRFPGGRQAGLQRLDSFVSGGLSQYGRQGSNPAVAGTSELSPYLHFGCVSPIEAALSALGSSASDDSVDAYLEQLIVRRELSYNFCLYAEDPRGFADLPNWALETMEAHRGDRRDPLYDRGTLERAETHDRIWNAAQRELTETGFMHTYLRMLWGKNIIRWTASYREALETMLAFFEKYGLDGRNPNTYVGILWCFGLHDRAYAERPVLGKLRPLTSQAAARKFKIEAYIARVEALAGPL